MPHKTFMAFIWPSLLAMVLFIAIPIVSVAYQSLFIEHEQNLVQVESCGPFGCTQQLRVDNAAMAKLRSESPMGRFNGLGTYTNSGHLAVAEISQIYASSTSVRDFLGKIMNLPFYKAMVFTK